MHNSPLVSSFLATIAVVLFILYYNFDSRATSYTENHLGPKVFYQLLTLSFPSDYFPHKKITSPKKWACNGTEGATRREGEWLGPEKGRFGRSGWERHDETQNWNEDGVKKWDGKERQQGKNRAPQWCDQRHIPVISHGCLLLELSLGFN